LELPQAVESERTWKTVCIFSSDDLEEIETIRRILEENDVPTIVKNQHTQNMFGGL